MKTRKLPKNLTDEALYKLSRHPLFKDGEWPEGDPIEACLDGEFERYKQIRDWALKVKR